MEIISIAAKRREIKGKQVKQVRSEGDVPAVVYGHGFENMDISVEGRTFDKVLSKAGESTLIELSIDGGEPLKVLVHEVQRHPLKGQVTHIDFRQVQMSEKLEADVELKLVGESMAVKALGGTLITSMNKVTVRCLPQDLVHQIEVDLSVIKEPGQSIRVADLVPPPGIEFVDGPEETIVVVTAAAAEEKPAEAPAEKK